MRLPPNPFRKIEPIAFGQFHSVQEFFFNTLRGQGLLPLGGILWVDLASEPNQRSFPKFTLLSTIMSASELLSSILSSPSGGT